MIVGLDEVGRGAWAGPLVVGAVCLSENILGLADSKKLNKNQRQALAVQIHNSASFVGIGIVEPSEIDSLGLSKAHFLGYKRAIAGYSEELPIIIDGNINYLPNLPNVKCVVRADQSVPEVSAASIIAKVYRDDLMVKLSLEFPGYGFDQHVGYGTKSHIESLIKHGITIIHRKSYKPIRVLANG